MKGLFYKEARGLWHFGKTYLLMLVIFLGLALYQSTDSSGGAVWMLYPIFFAGTLPASLIGDDEKSGWQSCCDTLPVTRRQIVTVKYITCLVTAAAVCLLAVPVVLFGNRNFDDGLIELRNILTEDGFMPVAGGAFVGEHAFSRTLGAGTIWRRWMLLRAAQRRR